MIGTKGGRRKERRKLPLKRIYRAACENPDFMLQTVSGQVKMHWHTFLRDYENIESDALNGGNHGNQYP